MSGCTSTNGPCHPPKNSAATIEHTTVTSPYSATKNKPQRMPEYSVRNPATSSDSASGRSNGTRLVSASPAMKYVVNASGTTRKLMRNPAWLSTIRVIDSEPTTSTTVTSDRIC